MDVTNFMGTHDAEMAARVSKVCLPADHQTRCCSATLRGISPPGTVSSTLHGCGYGAQSAQNPLSFSLYLSPLSISPLSSSRCLAFSILLKRQGEANTHACGRERGGGSGGGGWGGDGRRQAGRQAGRQRELHMCRCISNLTQTFPATCLLASPLSRTMLLPPPLVRLFRLLTPPLLPPAPLRRRFASFSCPLLSFLPRVLPPNTQTHPLSPSIAPCHPPPLPPAP